MAVNPLEKPVKAAQRKPAPGARPKLAQQIWNGGTGRSKKSWTGSGGAPRTVEADAGLKK